MRVSSPESGSTIVYKADQVWCDHVRKTRKRLSGICAQCMHRPVRVQTIDGHTYEGTVIGSDAGHLYLQVNPAAGDYRFLGPFAAGSILPLVLYELLVITLLI
ncbi:MULTISPECIES: hypothetical protein [Cohnella]|uniref:hypothetical protein n=1 Tax=Cohnella TaxID=329857 RepID=UPI00037DF03C|nr:MULTISPECIES: hypothetical protein [Cohnella]REK66550.1 MAG: acetyl-CoA acetyltransferase [Cohnella sp.]